jgi:hypothetical protein
MRIMKLINVAFFIGLMVALKFAEATGQDRFEESFAAQHSLKLAVSSSKRLRSRGGSIRSTSSLQLPITPAAARRLDHKSGKNSPQVTLPQSTPAPFTPTIPSSTVPSSPTLLGRANSSNIPICKVDPEFFFIPANDPRYTAPDTTEKTSAEVTFEAADATLTTIDDSLTAIADVGEVVGGIEKLASFAKVAAGIGSAAIVLNVAVNVLGPMFGLKSQDDVILEAITEGFKKLNDRLDTIQFELRAGFLELALFIADVALDEFASRLTAQQRAFNAYANATDATRPLHEPKWRGVCNEPFFTPEDIFYDLYGFVCSNCSFASRKRADFYDKAKEKNPMSGSNFFDTFADFMLRGMLQALTLHTLCLPPVEGSCVDRSIDPTWQTGIATMNLAYDEAIQRVTGTVQELDDFVPKVIANHQEIVETIVKPEQDNQIVADKIRDYFVAKQPAFHFQVLVVWQNNHFHRDNVWRSFPDPPVTVTDQTGHFFLDNIEGRSVSVRYRLKSLPLPSTTVTILGQTNPFSDFYQMLTKRITRVDEANEVGGDECPVENSEWGRARACTVEHCIECSPEEQAAFDGIVGYFYIGRIGVDGFAVVESTSHIESFPRFDVKFVLTYFGEEETVDEFRFHYA